MWLRGGDACIGCKVLAVLLFTSVNGERKGRVDAFQKHGHVAIDLVLPDVAIAIADVVDEVMDQHVVETFVGFIEFCVEHGLDGFGDLVDGNASHVLESLPVAEGCLVFSLEALAFGGNGARCDGGVWQWCVHWWSVCGIVAC